MAQSLSKLLVHIVFHIKNTKSFIRTEDQQALYAYTGAIIKDKDSIPIITNGMKDHVHILCVMSKNIALAKLVEEIKRHSSRWIKGRGRHYLHFSWQGGYGGFSVSSSKLNTTKAYILNQEEHHKTMTFKEELERFFKEYGIEFDGRYLWND